ncbi:hypothetical protein [Nonomuraea sp. NPDC049141]|uniref:hypothetical protein n=1 Tax=Nonomuraea sp. NPDC049141 TaxID=3155500 RepID=UPI00340D3CC4
MLFLQGVLGFTSWSSGRTVACGLVLVAGGIFSVSREISGLLGIAAIGVIVHEVGSFSQGYALVLLSALIASLALP